MSNPDSLEDLGALQHEVRAPLASGWIIFAVFTAFFPLLIIVMEVAQHGRLPNPAVLIPLTMAVGLVWLGLAVRPWLHVHAKGVARKGLFGRRSIPFADVAVVTSADSAHQQTGYHGGGLIGGLLVTLIREGIKGPTYTLTATGGTPQVKVDRLFGRKFAPIVKGVIDASVASGREKAEADIKRGGEYKSANGLTLAPNELKGKRAKLFGSEDVSIPFAKIDKLEAGNVYNLDTKAGFLGRSAEFTFNRAIQDLVLVDLLKARKIKYEA